MPSNDQPQVDDAAKKAAKIQTDIMDMVAGKPLEPVVIALAMAMVEVCYTAGVDDSVPRGYFEAALTGYPRELAGN